MIKFVVCSIGVIFMLMGFGLLSLMSALSDFTRHWDASQEEDK